MGKWRRGRVESKARADAISKQVFLFLFNIWFEMVPFVWFIFLRFGLGQVGWNLLDYDFTNFLLQGHYTIS